jgi:predicted ABC-type ATPase
MGTKLYVNAGCNRTGKTTASYTIQPNILNCKEHIDADKIARGLSPFQPQKIAVEVDRFILKQINVLLNKDRSFIKFCFRDNAFHQKS